MNNLIKLSLIYICIKVCDSSGVIDFVTGYGYPIEVHSNVTTQDGYIISLFRIPHGVKEKETDIREPVLLVHPLTESAEVFVFLDPDKSLGFLLPDKGYDVWMMNIRATSYSRKHVKLDPEKDKKAFWNFTLTELALDVTASIDYVLNITGFDQLMYVGHSQGTTLFMISMAEHPEYNKKIKLAALLSPAVFLGGGTNIMKLVLTATVEYVQAYLEAVELYEIHFPIGLAQTIFPWFCANFGEVCKMVIMLAGGWNPKQIDVKYLPRIANNFFEGMSLYEVIHYLQMSKSNKFRKYDYGVKENLIRYGSEEPTEYDLSNIVAPIALYYSEADNIVSAEGVRRLINLLPNVVDSYSVNDTLFSHLDFIIATDIVPLLYNRIIDLMEMYRVK